MVGTHLLFKSIIIPINIDHVRPGVGSLDWFRLRFFLI